jgi:hypothetical protein
VVRGYKMCHCIRYRYDIEAKGFVVKSRPINIMSQKSGFEHLEKSNPDPYKNRRKSSLWQCAGACEFPVVDSLNYLLNKMSR